MSVTSRDRLAAALRGGVADRPPVALWRHFPEQDQSAPALAAATLAWQRDFPGDFVKFMPPGDYPTIDWGLRSVFDGAAGGTRRPIFHPVSEARDWERLPAIDVRTGFNAEILAAVGLTRRGLPDEVPLLQTIFSPLTVAAKLSNGAVTTHLQEAPAAVHVGLRRIVEVTRAFALASLAAGADGFFFATQLADHDRLDHATYREYGGPTICRFSPNCPPTRRSYCISTARRRCSIWPIVTPSARFRGTIAGSGRVWPTCGRDRRGPSLAVLTRRRS